MWVGRRRTPVTQGANRQVQSQVQVMGEQCDAQLEQFHSSVADKLGKAEAAVHQRLASLEQVSCLQGSSERLRQRGNEGKRGRGKEGKRGRGEEGKRECVCMLSRRVGALCEARVACNRRSRCRKPRGGA